MTPGVWLMMRSWQRRVAAGRVAVGRRTRSPRSRPGPTELGLAGRAEVDRRRTARHRRHDLGGLGDLAGAAAADEATAASATPIAASSPTRCVRPIERVTSPLLKHVADSVRPRDPIGLQRSCRPDRLRADPPRERTLGYRRSRRRSDASTVHDQQDHVEHRDDRAPPGTPPASPCRRDSAPADRHEITAAAANVADGRPRRRSGRPEREQRGRAEQQRPPAATAGPGRPEPVRQPAYAGPRVVGQVGQHVREVRAAAEQRTGGDQPPRRRRRPGQSERARTRPARRTTTRYGTTENDRELQRPVVREPGHRGDDDRRRPPASRTGARAAPPRSPRRSRRRRPRAG